MDQDPPETLTTAQTADLLGVSRSTVTRLVKAGTLQGFKLTTAPNSPLRIARPSVEALIELRQPDEKEAAARAGTAA